MIATKEFKYATRLAARLASSVIAPYTTTHPTYWIQRRKAAMIRAVLLAGSSKQRWLQDGLNEDEVRLPPLGEDDAAGD